MKKPDSTLTRSLLCAALALAAASCQSGENETAPTAFSVDEASPVIQAAEVPARKMSSELQIEYARKDLARRLDVGTDQVALSGANPVTWRSGALGCPEPGMNYTQALTSGVLIYLRVGQDAYRYHAKSDGKPFYCPRERAETPVYGEGDT